MRESWLLWSLGNFGVTSERKNAGLKTWHTAARIAQAFLWKGAGGGVGRGNGPTGLQSEDGIGLLNPQEAASEVGKLKWREQVSRKHWLL